MHTSRNCVTNYIHNFNVIVLGRELCLKAGVNDMLAAGCPVVGREMLATGFPNDWLDQTMSYQLIQTTSFAMHPRLLTAELFFFDTSPADFTVPVPAGSLIGVPAGPPTYLALAADSYRSS
ncbi:serine/threonine-protein kinase TOR-like [Dorcoceras hygrometricum]|uniref:Serine/threonine-protein kinase TOR-like n=1 Tax=Dorcoceras hygrometricum TaxID=472368 RepID=A0A2Z7BU20_9LAMI|nr:serine/threonine-protein kinase TOR-like [Dorcoceras hygrometricum]